MEEWGVADKWMRRVGCGGVESLLVSGGVEGLLVSGGFAGEWRSGVCG